MTTIDRFQTPLQALALFLAGESLVDVAAEYGIPLEQLADALRVASRHAA